MAKCPTCLKVFTTPPQKYGCCSSLCVFNYKGPRELRLKCRNCARTFTALANTNEASYKVCSKACYEQLNRNNGVSAGELMINFLFTQKTHEFKAWFTDAQLATVAQVSTTLNTGATRAQLGQWYEKPAIHFDQRRGEVEISRDDMIQIALSAYRAATALKQRNVPVVLYRVSDKNKLARHEEELQTVAGAVRNDNNLWPVERTAAWIQGALRARIPFLVLTDPRGADALVGGKDKNSDAVYVRELYQIIQNRYIIRQATQQEKPEGMRRGAEKIFVLEPPTLDPGPLPLVPRMSANMDYTHTWDSSKSSLTIDAPDVGTMADYVIQRFKEAGIALGM